MSYQVDLPATVLGPEFDSIHPCSNVISVSTFAGGERGRMVQIAHPYGSFACLTMDQLDRLIDVLTHARAESLISHRWRDMEPTEIEEEEGAA